MCNNDKNGWVRLYRSMEECGSARRGLAYYGAMCWLASHAAYREEEEEGWGTLQPGQCVVSIRNLANEWHCGVQTVRSVLCGLVEDGFITIRTHHKWKTLVTICKYGKYQYTEEKDDANTNTLSNTLTNTLSNTLTNTLKTDQQDIEHEGIEICRKDNTNTLSNTLSNTLTNTLSNTPMYARTRVLSSDSKEYLKNFKEMNTVVEVRTADAQPPPSEEFKLSNDVPESRRKKPVQPITFDYDGDMDFHGDQLPQFIELWKRSFPAIDVIKELGKASAWLSALSVPKRKKDIKAFLSRWLGKAQEQYDRQISMQGGGRMSPAEYAKEKKLAREQEAGLLVGKKYDSVQEDPVVAALRKEMGLAGNGSRNNTNTGGNNE